MDASSDDSASRFSITNEKENIFVRGIHSSFRALGKFVARYAYAVIIVCTLMTVIGVYKIKHTPKKSDLSGYAPYGARSRHELAAYEQFFDHEGQGIKVLVLILAKDNGTLLRPSHLKETVDLIDFISENFTIYNAREKKEEGFDDYCYGFCLYNEPVRQFYNGYQIQRLNPTARVNLSYPLTQMFGRTFSLQPNFFGIDTYSDNEMEELRSKNKTVLTNMKNAKMILLQFRGERDASWTDEQIKSYEVSISEYFMKEYQSENLKVLVVSTSFAQKEIQRGGLQLQPFLAVGFAIMTVFTVITTLISSAFAHQCSWYKVINAMTACIVPFMSCGAAFGMLFFAGVRFGPIILVTPFLILAIGVDDSFLMMHAWQRVVSKLQKHPHPDDCIEYRIAEVLAESGPSITLSALTNIMAFAVGALTSPPEVELFCIANAWTLLVDTIFSVTLYAAIMAVCGKREMQTENQKTSSSENLRIRLKSTINACYAFLNAYIKWITMIPVSILIMLTLICYISVASYGVLNLGIDLSTRKFFLQDSVLLEADAFRSKYVIPYFTPAIVVVNNPGNLSDPRRIEKLNHFVESFESMNNSIGADTTKFFLRDYEEYKNPFGEEEEDGRKPFNANDLDDFLAWPEYSFWKGFLKIKNGTDGGRILDKFFFNVGFEGEELKSWEERGRLLTAWRNEVDKYWDDFNATIYSDDALFLDLIQVIPSVSWQSASATLICMAVACFLYMYDFMTVVVATFSICSICLGTFGFLHFWSIEQDPIMMAAVIMSIGFSVDIPAHIAFHYYRTGVTASEVDPPVQERLKHTLAAVGFPVIQAGTSTILCVCSLLMVPMYMSEVFVKTMFLCITLGLIHGLFIMPAIFNLYQQAKNLCCRKKQHKDNINVTLKGVRFFEGFDKPKNAVVPA